MQNNVQRVQSLHSCVLFNLGHCTDGSVELMQSSESSGVVILCVNSKFYLICDSGWDHVDASVACKSAGLSPYGAVALLNQYVATTSDYTFLSYIDCNGSELNLAECQLTPQNSSCQYNYTGIHCQGMTVESCST